MPHYSYVNLASTSLFDEDGSERFGDGMNTDNHIEEEVDEPSLIQKLSGYAHTHIDSDSLWQPLRLPYSSQPLIKRFRSQQYRLEQQPSQKSSG
ncbi:unnamed protein product [Protopolystoma xenopodis]|uniref:Uncharacterized protein n=1 Tax=Protopolystoma xenopodis TaxID=117903 RepID=A0A448X9D8_9PLAT|nr:unnamed protein product [Protopolystoma xenopodis]